MKSVILWIYRHWLAIVNSVVALFVLGAVLAPALMKAGLPGPATALYTLYGFTCHQLPQRSYFLFGAKLMYPLDRLLDAWPQAGTLWQQRAILGDPVFGYKAALGNRCSAIYPAILVSGLIVARRRSHIRPLSLKAFAVLALPMFLDGTSHLVSEVFGFGFRDTNAWLQWLTQGAFATDFYVGDTLGSFNWLMRTLTGGLFGIAVVWISYPYFKLGLARSGSKPSARVADTSLPTDKKRL